jgi:hypothetical protein
LRCLWYQWMKEILTLHPFFISVVST